MDQGIDVRRRSYFAASNSANGFVSYYDTCFGTACGVQRLYVIKGGPGTGKSRFMTDVAAEAVMRGYEVDYYYCSSDDRSLDGIRLTRQGRTAERIGIIDGTAPHVWEPTLPGVQEELVNLGDFWDSHRLLEHADRIKQLDSMKKQCYEMAYRYLHAYGEMQRIGDRLIHACTAHDKINALADRIVRQIPGGRVFFPEPALQNAVGMNGRAHLPTFERAADVLYRVDRHYGVEYAVTEALLNRSRDKKLSVLVSWNPICPWLIDGLFWPEASLAVVIEPEEAVVPYRRIYLQHYTDASLVSGLRSEIRYAQSVRRQLLEGACAALDKASGYHFELEAIYTSAMDFAAKESFAKQFCHRILE